MDVDRRSFSAGALAMATLAGNAAALPSGDSKMYGLISKIVAQPGHRDQLAMILLEGVTVDALPGCLSYIVAVDPSDANSLWVTEVWRSRDYHAASLALPSVKAEMNKGRNLIASFSRIAETTPVGGLDVRSKHLPDG
jgi:quinol monooxygenase YgiN